MSVGNYGAVKNLLESWIGVDVDGVTGQGTTFGARSNQGVAILPSLIHQVLARPDFANTLNAKLYPPTLNSTSTYLAIDTVATNLIAVVWDNSAAATDAYVSLFGTATPTLGTTAATISFYAKASTQGVFLMPQPTIALTNTGLAWASLTTGTNGSTTSTTQLLTLAAVYTK